MVGLFDRLLGAPSPLLRSEAVTLRMPVAADYPAWHDLRDQSRAFLTPWEPAWSDDELSRRAFALRLKRYRQDAQERSGYTFFIFDAGGRTLHGGLTLGQIRRGVAQSAMLGYWMGERFAGAGRMSEAVRLLTAFAFDVEHLHRLEAACLPTNHRSTALLQKSGFRWEGHLRRYLKIAGRWEDHHLYALLADEWTRSDSSQHPRSLTAA